MKRAEWVNCDPDPSETRQEDIVCASERRQRITHTRRPEMLDIATEQDGRVYAELKAKRVLERKTAHTTLACKASISALIFSCSLS